MRRLLLFLAALTAAGLSACSDDTIVGRVAANQPPRVWLGGAPPEGAVSDYRIHLSWGGWDADGEIRYFEYVITDNDTGAFDPADTTSSPGDYKWHRIDRTDSVFSFSADLVADSTDFGDNRHEPEEFRRSHTIFVRAVDDRGARSSAPAYRSFTARNFSPIAHILIPRWTGSQPAVMSSIATFEAAGQAFIGQLEQVADPAAIRWILVSTAPFADDWQATESYIRSNPDAAEWSEWRAYAGGTSWTPTPLEWGGYVLAVQVRDEAGAVNPVYSLSRNMRRVLIREEGNGPLLSVNNRYTGTIVTSGLNTPPVIAGIPGGLAMSFRWSADARAYGGIVTGHRYGWDITDLNVDDEWDVPFTPFVGSVAQSPPRRFFFGIHTFYLEVIDNSGFKTRVIVRLNVVPATMNRRLLVVDDWAEGPSAGFVPTKGALPSDAEHDAFWEAMADGVSGFVPSADVIDLSREPLPLPTLLDYQNVIWSAAGSPSGRSASVLGDLIRFRNPKRIFASGKVSANLVAMFMGAGGHVLLAGQHVMALTIDPQDFIAHAPLYPLIFRYELAGDQEDGIYGGQDVGVRGIGEDSFAYAECCLNVLDIAYLQNPNQIRLPTNQFGPASCPVDDLRDHDGRTDGLRTALPLDAKTGGGFPNLTLRAQVASDPTRFYHETKLGLDCDIYNPLYFAEMTPCGIQAELQPPRGCIEPIYGNGCLNQASNIYGAAVAFWTSQFAAVIPDAGGVAARSAVWGFHPVYFNPAEVKQALEIILFDEWLLPRK